MSEPLQLLRRATPLLAMAGLVSAVALIGAGGSEGFSKTITETLVTVLVVVGLYLFVGNSGVLSFGHVAFMALGAYTTAWLTIPPGLKTATLPDLPGFLAEAHTSPVVAVLVSGVVAALLAAVAALPLMRLNGIAAAIGTLSLLVIVNVVLSNWDELTNGTGTIVGVPSDLDPMSALPWVLAVLAIAFGYQQSRRGNCLRATREDPVAAQSVGIGVARERRVAFVLSAFCVGIGGSLYAQYLGAFAPGRFYLDLTFLTLAMLVIGGMRSLTGAVVGTLLVTALSEILSGMQDDGIALLGAQLELRAGVREVVLAGLMLVILVFRPDGITGGRELSWPRRRRSQGGRPPVAAVAQPHEGATSK